MATPKQARSLSNRSALIDQALEKSGQPFRAGGKGRIVVKSVPASSGRGGHRNQRIPPSPPLQRGEGRDEGAAEVKAL